MTTDLPASLQGFVERLGGEPVCLPDSGSWLFPDGTTVDTLGCISPASTDPHELYRSQKYQRELVYEEAARGYNKMRNNIRRDLEVARNKGSPLPFPLEQAREDLTIAKQRADAALAELTAFTANEHKEQQRQEAAEEDTRQHCRAKAEEALTNLGTFLDNGDH